MRSLRSRIIRILEESWPTSFSQWTSWHAEVQATEAAHRAAPGGMIAGRYFDDSVPEPASAIRLALDFDIPTILPAAFYTLAGIPSSHDWDNVRAHSPEKLKNPPYRTARWTLLDRAVFWRLTRGREELVRHLARWEASFMYKPTDLPSSPEHATHARAARCQYAHSQIPQWCHLDGVWNMAGALAPNPLRDLGKVHEMVLKWGLCGPCSEALRKRIVTQQRDLWVEVPRMFEL